MFKLIRLANNSIFKNPLRSILSLIGISVGMTFLLLSLGLGEGAKLYINKTVNQIQYPRVALVSKSDLNQSPDIAGSLFPTEPKDYKGEDFGFGGSKLMNNQDIEKIKQTEGLEILDSYQGNASGDRGVFGKYLQYNDKKLESQNIVGYQPFMKIATASGTSNFENGKSQAVVGFGFASKLGLSPKETVGKKIQIAFKNNNQSNQSSDLVKEFEIIGVIPKGLFNNTNLIIDIQSYQEVYTKTNTVSEDTKFTSVLVSYKEGVNESDFRGKLSKKGFFTQNYQESINQALSIFTNLQIGLAIFSAIIIAVSLFGIANNMLVSVIQRTKDVGIMKAVGAKNYQVFFLFSLEGILLGFWGSVVATIFSFIVGSLGNWLFNSAFEAKIGTFDLFVFQPIQVLLAFLGIIAVTFLASALPAIRASRINPIKALKSE